MEASGQGGAARGGQDPQMLHVKRKLITEMMMFSSTDLAWVLNVPKRHSSKESYLKRLANLKVSTAHVADTP